jgi:shikimate kinase
VRAEHIVLCGTAGSGKSTVGALLAKALGRPFVDVDRAVEIAAGATIPELFAREGEPAFRVRERAAVRAALETHEPAVIALGGGALEHDDTFADVRQETLVWLLAGDPLARLRELAARRETRYREAHVTVNAVPPPRTVAHAILAELARRGGLAVQPV